MLVWLVNRPRSSLRLRRRGSPVHRRRFWPISSEDRPFLPATAPSELAAGGPITCRAPSSRQAGSYCHKLRDIVRRARFEKSRAGVRIARCAPSMNRCLRPPSLKASQIVADEDDRAFKVALQIKQLVLQAGIGSADQAQRKARPSKGSALRWQRPTGQTHTVACMRPSSC